MLSGEASERRSTDPTEALVPTQPGPPQPNPPPLSTLSKSPKLSIRKSRKSLMHSGRSLGTLITSPQGLQRLFEPMVLLRHPCPNFPESAFVYTLSPSQMCLNVHVHLPKPPEGTAQAQQSCSCSCSRSAAADLNPSVKDTQ